MSNRKWPISYVPDTFTKASVTTCREFGWLPPDGDASDSKGLLIKQCTNGCGRERAVGDDDGIDFYTCTTCRTGRTKAKNNNETYRPKPIDPVRHDCAGGCGRYMISCKTERIVGYCCPSCNKSLRAFVQARLAEQMAVKKKRMCGYEVQRGLTVKHRG